MNRQGSVLPLILIIFVLFILIGGAYYLGTRHLVQITNASPSPFPLDSPAGQWQTYRNANLPIEFRYPSDFAYTAPSIYFLADPIVGLVSSTSIPGTNLNERLLSLSWNPTLTQVTCYQDPKTKQPLTQTVSVNDLRFYLGRTGGVGAGNIYDSKFYRIFSSGSCFEIVLTVHTASVANFPSAEGIKEVSQDQAFAPLDQIFSTFRFTR